MGKGGPQGFPGALGSVSGWTPPGRCSNISWETRQQHPSILFPLLQGQLSVTLGSSVYLITPCTVASPSDLLPPPPPPPPGLFPSEELQFIRYQFPPAPSQEHPRGKGIVPGPEQVLVSQVSNESRCAAPVLRRALPLF